MKNALGKTLFLLLSLTFTLFAKSDLATYQLTSSKENVYVKEALEIKFVATQKERLHNMFFFLEPKKSDNYKIVLLNKEANELAHHKKETIFTFLLFPLKEGSVEVDFNFTIKVASDEAVAQVYQGSRDNVKWIETINTQVDLQPLILKVKKLKEDVDLVGDFTLTSKLQSDSVNSYESANVTYSFNGVGYDVFNVEPITKIKDVEIFSEITKHYDKETPAGYDIHREFNYALISKNDIVVKAKEFKCYSPIHDKFYTMKTQEYVIKVKGMDKSNLIDKVNYPESQDISQLGKTILTYLILFFSGFLTAKYFPSSFSLKKKQYSDVREAKNAKELLFLLMNKYDVYKLRVYYEPLNDIVYHDANARNFKKIKKQILKDLDK